MKLWKNNFIEKSNNINLSNKKKKLSINSIELDKNNPINKSIKENTEKNNDSIIKLLSNNNTNKNLSFYSSSEEDITGRKIDNMKNIKKNENLFRNNEKKFQNLLITTFPTVNDINTKSNKLNNIKSMYPKIKTKENQFLKSVSSFGLNRYKKNQFKIKKNFTPINSNNTILNKWREDFHKIFFKNIKRTKADFSNTFQRFYRNRNKLKLKSENRNLKKIIIKSITSKGNYESNNRNNTNEKNNIPKNNNITITINDNKINENIETNNINEISSERKKNITKGLQLDTSSNPPSPFKQINFSKSPKKKYLITTEQQYSASSNSSKSLNKFDYSQQNIKIYKNYKRRRNFREYMKEGNILDPTWKKKIGILDSEVKYSKALLSDIHFQSNTIKDEMNLLIDGIHHYKMRLFGNTDLITAFLNKDIFYQINLNKSLEETCALLHLIPKIILKEYYIYSDRFISISEPGKENFFTKIITNESECLNDNIRLLYKIISFVKSSYEVYIQLVQQVEDEMVIPLHDFEILRIIFQKSRYYIGNLINFANNILKDYNFDKILIKKCRPIFEQTKERLKYDWKYDSNNNKNVKHKRNSNYFNFNIKRKRNEDKDSICTKMNSNVNFVNNDFYQKILRITKALETGGNSKTIQSNYSDELKLKQAGVGSKNGPMALIFSPLMTKMLKYIRKDIREKIISLRSSQKYIDSKEE